MSMKNRIFIIAAFLLCTLLMSAQNRSALRISEVMVENNTNIVDDYGEHVGWIELFNTNFAPIEISSIYLTTDPKQPKMYPVPLGDHNTKVGKRQSVIFYTDGNPTRGTFHTNFTLKPNQSNWIGIYDANGKTLIDSVTVPPIAADASYAYVNGPHGERVWETRNGSTEELYITPGGPNTIKDTNNKIDKFADQDPHGFAMAAMAMCIVFSALLILAVAFLIISKIGESISRKNKAKAHGVEIQSIAATEMGHDSGEEIAAITMALYQHLNAHDQESAVLTINKVKRAYSPWSSKIYNMRVLPGKNLH